MEGYQQLYPHAAHAWRTWQVPSPPLSRPLSLLRLGSCQVLLDTQHSTLNTQHSTLNIQHSTLNTQRAPSLWQGTLSGKAGVTFEEKGCGAPMGEKGYGDLKHKVPTPPFTARSLVSTSTLDALSSCLIRCP